MNYLTIKYDTIDPRTKFLTILERHFKGISEISIAFVKFFNILGSSVFVMQCLSP
jgi:hypothetical protein